ncbi:hypothetical protein [Nostoc sp.]|uniref:hypothetical protein n=1 Tax=Nostoc sp. TaxID=1180 RepID=UPI002FF7D2EC
MIEKERLGKVAYHAYCNACNYKTFQDHQMEFWDDLDPTDKQKWIEVAQSVLFNYKLPFKELFQSLDGQTSINLVKPEKSQIGDYVSFEDLVAFGAIFYSIDGKPCADSPFHGYILESYMLETPCDPGFKRIK